MEDIYKIMKNYTISFENLMFQERWNVGFSELVEQTFKEICTILAKQEVEIRMLKEKVKYLENQPTE